MLINHRIRDECLLTSILIMKIKITFKIMIIMINIHFIGYKTEKFALLKVIHCYLQWIRLTIRWMFIFNVTNLSQCY